MRETWTRIVHTSGTHAYALLVALVTLTITARWLGPAGRGTIAAVTTWVLLFGTLGHLSLGQVMTYRATMLGGRSWLSPTLGSLLFVDALTSLAGWGLMWGLFAFTNAFQGLSLLPLAIGFVALPFALWEQHGTSLLLTLDRVGLYNAGQIVGRTTSVLLVLLAWYLNWGVEGVLAAAVLAQATTAMFGIRVLLREAGRPRVELATIVALLKGSARLHGNTVAGFVVSFASILIISHSLGSAATGQFQVAAQLILVLSVIPQAAATVMLAKTVQLGPDVAWLLQRRILAGMLLIMTPLALLAAFVAPWIIPLVLGAEFQPAVRLFQIQLISMTAVTLAWGMLPQWIARGMFVRLSLLVSIAGIMTLGANLWLVPKFGLVAAAWVAVASQGVVALGQVWMILLCERSAAQ